MEKFLSFNPSDLIKSNIIQTDITDKTPLEIAAHLIAVDEPEPVKSDLMRATSCASELDVMS